MARSRMRWPIHLITSLICFFAALAFPCLAAASEYHGVVTFAGFPVPGATITATQGTKTLATVSDQGGLYDFPDLTDGAWKIEIEMQCFSTIHADVTIAPQMPAAKWELALLPPDQILASAKLAPKITPPPAAAAVKKPAAASANAPDIPKPQEEASDQAADGFLVNGSVNNAATSRFSLDQAFGNRRYNSRSL